MHLWVLMISMIFFFLQFLFHSIFVKHTNILNTTFLKVLYKAHITTFKLFYAWYIPAVFDLIHRFSTGIHHKISYKIFSHSTLHCFMIVFTGKYNPTIFNHNWSALHMKSRLNWIIPIICKTCHLVFFISLSHFKMCLAVYQDQKLHLN